jgi:hypothetical protein
VRSAHGMRKVSVERHGLGDGAHDLIHRMKMAFLAPRSVEGLLGFVEVGHGVADDEKGQRQTHCALMRPGGRGSL